MKKNAAVLFPHDRPNTKVNTSTTIIQYVMWYKGFDEIFFISATLFPSNFVKSFNNANQRRQTTLLEQDMTLQNFVNPTNLAKV
jgi:hypothetical protein